MSDKYNYNEFKKILTDFVNDILVTFPEQITGLDENLLTIFQNSNKDMKKTETSGDNPVGDNPTDNDVEYSENYSQENDEKECDSDPEDLKTSIQEVFDYCCSVYPERFFDILYQNAEIFTDDDVNTKFLPGMDFGVLWMENISDKTRESIWKYLQLILFSIITNVDNKNTFGDTAKLFEAINEEEFKEKLEDTIKGLENIFDLSNLEQSAEDLSKNLFENMPDPKQIHDHISGIMNGKLGELAKELAEETAKDFDLTEENIKDPKDVFKTLFKNPQKLMNLVKNVGTKLDQKMKSGDIKESELLEEATNMFNNMKNVPGMENANMKDLFNNFNIGNMMKNMGMMPQGGRFNQNAFNSKMEQSMKASRARDRMRTKMEANQQQREAQSERNNNGQSGQSSSRSPNLDDSSVQNNIQKNLDFLFSNSGGGDLSKLNSDLQKLVEEMKQKNEANLNSARDTGNSGNNGIRENTNKKKKKGKKA